MWRIVAGKKILSLAAHEEVIGCGELFCFERRSSWQIVQQAERGQIYAAELLLLAPGAVQIFYGDETERPFGPTGSDPLQGTRSDMNWGQNVATLSHWQKISQFRARHPAIGAGTVYGR